MPECIYLDVSELEPPEPLNQIIERLPLVDEHRFLCIRHRREPFPLYGLLSEKQLLFRSKVQPSGAYIILIWSSQMLTPPAIPEAHLEP